VLTGLTPFHPLRDAEISYKVILGERPVMPSNAKDLGISDELWQLLFRCWYTNYTKRPSINEILRHLYNDPARALVFPPSQIPPASSCESVVPNTQKYGNGLWFELVYQCSYSCTGDMFVTAGNVQTPIEGMLGATL
jgi:hypothetical protein